MQYVAQVVPMCTSRLAELRTRAKPILQSRAAVCGILFVVGIVLLVFFTRSDTRRRRAKDASVQLASQLMASAVQWIETSKQDQNALLRWKHAQMAQIYLSAARGLVSDTQLEQVSGMRVTTFTNTVRTSIDSSSQALTQRCSKLRKEMRAVNNLISMPDE